MSKKHSCGDHVLAVLVIILALVVLFNLALHYADYIPVSRHAVPYPASQTTAAAGNVSAAQQVRLDYLYADWCSYCTLTAPALNSVVMKLGPSVSLHPYEESLRKTDPSVKALYDDYKARRLFTLFPTIVAHGPKGDAAIAGLMTNETALLGWVCSQYTEPPAVCK